MIITLSPIRTDQTYTLERSGEALVFDGQRVDFAGLEKGSVLENDALDCPWILGDVTRDAEGVLRIVLALPLSDEASDDALYPKPIEKPEDGPIKLPT